MPRVGISTVILGLRWDGKRTLKQHGRWRRPWNSIRGNQRQFVEDVEAQGREFLATSEGERFMEIVILEEQAERVITGEDYRRLAYLWAMQRCELRAHWMAQLAHERARPEPSAPPLTGSGTPNHAATSSAAAQNSVLGGQGVAEQRPQPPASPKPCWKWQ